MLPDRDEDDDVLKRPSTTSKDDEVGAIQSRSQSQSSGTAAHDQQHFLTSEHHLGILYPDDPVRTEGADVRRTESFKATVKRSARSMGAFFGRIGLLGWITRYEPKKYLVQDLLNGLVIGLVLIPQGLAYAVLSSMPPEYGLYTALFGPLFYFFLGSSAHLAIGPFALVSLLFVDTISPIVSPETDLRGYLDAVMTVSLFSGVVMTLLGLFGIGVFIMRFLSKPFISGLTTSGAFLIVASQLKHAWQVSVPSGSTFFVTLYYIVEEIVKGNANWVSFGLFCLTIFVLASIRFINLKFKKRVPGPLLASVVNILLVYFLKLDTRTIGEIPSGIPPPRAPRVNDLGALIGPILLITIIGFVLSASTGSTLYDAEKKRVEAIRRQNDAEPDETKKKTNLDTEPFMKLDSNVELVAVGLTNVLSSFFNAHASFASLSRSAIAFSLETRSPFHNVSAAMLVLLVLLVASPLLAPMPYAALAAIVIFSLRGLFVQMRIIKLYYRAGAYADLFVWCLTLLLSLIFGIVAGLIGGISLSLVVLIRSISKPHWAVLGKLPDTPDDVTIFRNRERFTMVESVPRVVIIRFDATLCFANAATFREAVLECVLERKDDPEPVHSICLDASAINSIDWSGLEMLRSLRNNLHEVHNVELLLANPHYTLRHQLSRCGLSFARFVSLEDCVAYAAHKTIISKPTHLSIHVAVDDADEVVVDDTTAADDVDVSVHHGSSHPVEETQPQDASIV